MYRTSARPAPLQFPLPSTHSSLFGLDHRKDIAVPHTLSHLTPAYLEAPVRDGLRTPPADDMGTTYQQPQYNNNYAVKQEGTYPTSTTPGNGYSGPYSASNGQAKPYHSLNHPTTVSASSLRNEILPSQAVYHQPMSPQIPRNVQVKESPLARRKSVNSDVSAIQPNLQIPPSINNSRGSLAEFAAQITCLFWFEPTETLKKAEQQTLPCSPPVTRLRDEAIPSTGFKKWVVTVLSTTQVTQNVVLLALLFIYRLKTINPAVKGRSGSEYRLLTVALMLGNKFLDDNTYTNKTWAEVSGISVGEIHVMEVEFLSNMRYSLLASKEQWEEWQQKLGKFSIYCDEASRMPLPHPSSGLHTMASSSLASPPKSLHSSPPSASRHPGSAHPQNWTSNPYSAPLLSPLPAMPDLDLRARKRSLDDDSEEPAAKRVTRSTPVPMPPLTSRMPPLRQDAPRLPVPNLTISTSQAFNGNYNSRHNGYNTQNVPLLPPLSGRAMSSVFPATPTWTPQLPMLTPTGPNQNGAQTTTASGYTTPSRRTSPHSMHDLLSLGSSPVSANFPNYNSPSFYLQQRASPYKPVRHVNTLLYPPPSASMHDYSITNADQMHYQPLGKRNDYRTGIAYPPYHQQQWTLPQPNFHT